MSATQTQEAPTATVKPAPQIGDDVQNTVRLIARLAKEKFFGELALQFVDGRIANIRKNQNLKPNEVK